MRIGNDSDDEREGGLSEFIRLQAEFQARLADETMRYLRRLQATAGPHTPGTVVLPDEGSELRAQGTPGGRAELRVEVENRQAVHCVVTPALTPFVQPSGAAWFPDADPSPPSTLLGPGDIAELRLDVSLPAELPEGTWHGALLLHGFRGGGLPVQIEVQP